MGNIVKFGESCTNANATGKCAGECCGVITMPLRLIWGFQKRWQRQVTEVRRYQLGGKKLAVALTVDSYCVFLSPVTKRCVIYDQRPKVCRMYGLIEELPCPFFHPDGRPRTEQEQKLRLVRMVRQTDKWLKQWGIESPKVEKAESQGGVTQVKAESPRF